MSGTSRIEDLAAAGPKKGDTKGYYAYSEGLGCGGSKAGPEKTLACLRKIPTDKIFSTQLLPRFVGGRLTALTIGNAPYPDNELVFSDYGHRETEGNFIRVPMLVGSTEHEVGTALKGLVPADQSIADSKEYMTANLATLMSFGCAAASVCSPKPFVYTTNHFNRQLRREASMMFLFGSINLLETSATLFSIHCKLTCY
jgi:hypothetical protein